MPNTVRASGEAMPKINRRRFLRNTTLAGAAVVVAAPATASATPDHDQLIDAINAYRRGIADFNAFARLNDDDEALDTYAEASYMPPMERLIGWTEPAQTKAGAIEALRFAASETLMFEASPMVQPLLAAALAYFEREARQ